MKYRYLFLMVSFMIWLYASYIFHFKALLQAYSNAKTDWVALQQQAIAVHASNDMYRDGIAMKRLRHPLQDSVQLQSLLQVLAQYQLKLLRIDIEKNVTGDAPPHWLYHLELAGPSQALIMFLYQLLKPPTIWLLAERLIYDGQSKIWRLTLGASHFEVNALPPFPTLQSLSFDVVCQSPWYQRDAAFNKNNHLSFPTRDFQFVGRMIDHGEEMVLALLPSHQLVVLKKGERVGQERAMFNGYRSGQLQFKR